MNAKKWQQNHEPQLRGDKLSYKIERNNVLGRGRFGTVYRGIQENSKNKDPYVAIKQYKNSQQWENHNDFDKELKILGRIKNMGTHKRILPIRDIIRCKITKRWNLVMKLCDGRTLLEKMKHLRDNEKLIKHFINEMASNLHFIHTKLFQNYKQINSQNSLNQSIGLLHRDIKPSNIIFEKMEETTAIYLLDFGAATITTTSQYRQISEAGTEIYRAPQLGTYTVNTKADIWSFGATLYQVFSDGDKLFNQVTCKYPNKQKEMIINNKLTELYQRLLSKKYQGVLWVNMLKKCLEIQPGHRYTAKDIMNIVQDKEKFLINGLIFTERNLDNHLAFQRLHQFNFQVFRLIYIQDIVFNLFEYIYFEDHKISRFNFYVIVKYTIFYLSDQIKWIKERIKFFINEAKNRKNVQLAKAAQQKYNHLKKNIEESKIQIIRSKCTEKIKKEIEKSSFGQENIKKNEEQLLIEKYPQITFQHLVESRLLLYEYVSQQYKIFLVDIIFTRNLTKLLFLIDDYERYEEVSKIDIEVAKEGEVNYKVVQLMSLKKMNKFILDVQQRISKLEYQKEYQEELKNRTKTYEEKVKEIYQLEQQDVEIIDK